jgi:hypothetical protein
MPIDGCSGSRQQAEDRVSVLTGGSSGRQKADIWKIWAKNGLLTLQNCSADCIPYVGNIPNFRSLHRNIYKITYPNTNLKGKGYAQETIFITLM